MATLSQLSQAIDKEKMNIPIHEHHITVRVLLYRKGSEYSDNGFCAAYVNVRAMDDYALTNNEIQWQFECNGMVGSSKRWRIQTLIEAKPTEACRQHNLFKIEDIIDQTISIEITISEPSQTQDTEDRKYCKFNRKRNHAMNDEDRDEEPHAELLQPHRKKRKIVNVNSNRSNSNNSHRISNDQSYETGMFIIFVIETVKI